MMNLAIIKDELLEAEKALQAFIADEQNLKNIEQAATLLADSNRKVKCFLVGMADRIVMPCTLLKS